jgi:hypothetical protein
MDGMSIREATPADAGAGCYLRTGCAQTREHRLVFALRYLRITKRLVLVSAAVSIRAR